MAEKLSEKLDREGRTLKVSKKLEIEALVFDKNTGEEIPDVALLDRRRRYTLKNWLRIFHRGTIAMALDPEIRKESYRVFNFAIGHIDYENKILLNQNDIARGLNMKQQCVNRAFKQLAEKGIFVEGKKHGTVKTYYLNPEYGWKGSERNLKKLHEDEFKQLQQEMKGISPLKKETA
jgi:DNA-binding transcriptional regulator YhcF (GntR family)